MKGNLFAAHTLSKVSKSSFGLLFDTAREMVGSRDRKIEILDVGSYLGSFAQEAIRSLGHKELEIHCFDAFKGNIEAAQRTVSDPRVTFHNAAVTREDAEEVVFSIPRASFVNEKKATWGGRVAQEASAQQYANDEQIVVSGKSLLSFCNAQGITRPDIVKMDIQGGEYEAMLGMGEHLRQSKLLFIECQLKHGRDLRYIDLLRKNGFIVMMDSFQFAMAPGLSDERTRDICEMIGIEPFKVINGNVYGYSKDGGKFMKAISENTPMSALFSYFQTDLIAVNRRFGDARFAFYETLLSE